MSWNTWSYTTRIFISLVEVTRSELPQGLATYLNIYSGFENFATTPLQ